MNWYHILEEISDCTNGIVYRAHDSLGVEVIIKKVNKVLYSPIEVDNYRRMSHIPCIPKLICDFEELYHVVIVMELINRLNVEQMWIEMGNWDYCWSQLIHIIKSIQQLHIGGFYHGDIHLSNMLWSSKVDMIYFIDLDKCGEINHAEVNHIDQHRINNNIRNNYNHILNFDAIDLLLNDEWSDYNGGRSKYQRLCTISKTIPCEGIDKSGTYVDRNEYANRLISAYKSIDESE